MTPLHEAGARHTIVAVEAHMRLEVLVNAANGPMTVGFQCHATCASWHSCHNCF